MRQSLFIIVTLLLVSSCVTQKRRGEASGIKKLYHDVTAEYNGYFNAVERLKLVTANLSTQTPTNYNRILPIYPYVEVENPKAAASDLDEALKKVTVVAALHEPSHWVDDCYLVAGKAQYLKQDYEAAEETLEYLLREFSPQAKLNKSKLKSNKPKSKAEVKKERAAKVKAREKVKKEREKTAAQKRKEYNKKKKQRERDRKKARKAKQKGKSVPAAPKPAVVEPSVAESEPKKEEPKEELSEKELKKQKKEEEDLLKQEEPKGPFKHRPAFQEGQLWLARTYIERDKYDQAAYLLKQLNEKKNIYPEVARELAPLTAYFYLKQKNYDEAISPLERAVVMADNRDDKARYAYILAQIQEQKGNSSEAFEYYSRVVRLRPNYEMEFNARLSMIINEYQSDKISPETAISKLERMLKDEKNIDYFDRIYFSIAEVYLKNNDETKGVEYLELALQQQGSSNVQQGETHLKLARIYFQKENYLKAADYYGKALSSLSKSDDRYLEVERLSTSLKDIASRIQTITLQDSLLKISAMSLDEKRAFAFDMKKKQDEDRRNALKDAAKTSPTSRGRIAGPRLPTPTPTGGATGLASATKSNWFAYDDRAVKRGKRDFAQKWGARTLEDDWRRSNKTKTSATIATVDSTASNTNDLTTGLLSDDQVANVLKGVPQSKTQIEEAENTLMTALFELGVLYRDRLKNLEKSVETFEQLLARFPDTKYKAEAMYYLYLLHKELGNPINAQNYFDRLIAESPNSIYAKILNDPDYLSKIQNEERRLNDFYDDTYEMFSSGNFQGAFNNLQQVESKFGATNVLQPRFALLTAMTLGKLEGKDAYVRTLKEVIAKYPNTDEQKRAREILRLLGDTASGLAGLENTATADGNFIFEPDEAHYIIIALNPDASLTDAKVVVSDFNKKYYKLENLRITNIFLENEGKERIPLVVIRRFKTQKEAMDYYQNTKLNSNDFLQGAEYQIFPVTQNNYSEIIKNKNLEAYKEFFEDKYL